jgi:hypothetical protein
MLSSRGIELMGGGTGLGRFLLTLLITAAALLALARPGHAATVQVSNTEALQAAVENAQNGDTIQLAPGVYAPDAPLVLGSNVTIEGPDAAGPVGGSPGPVILGSNMEGADSSDVVTVGQGVDATIANVSIRLASSEGSALVVDGTLHLEDSELSANNSFSVVLVAQSGTLKALNVTIGDNLGGGVEAWGDASFVNTTIADNGVAGIYNHPGSTVSITNTIVAGNGDGTANRDDCFRTVQSVSSLDGDGSCGANHHGDPKLGPLDLNGGPTATMALLEGSPAIDAGAAAACPALDQRLAQRVGTCDLGAFEYGAKVPPPSPTPVAGPSPSSPGTRPSALPSSSPGGTKPGVAARVAKKTSTVVAAGKISVHGGKATFKLRAVLGTRAGFLSFDDPRGHVRLRTTQIASISTASGGQSATIRGTTLNRASGRRVTFRITVRPGKPGSFAISFVDGYSRMGHLVTGRVAIAI